MNPEHKKYYSMTTKSVCSRMDQCRECIDAIMLHYRMKGEKACAKRNGRERLNLTREPTQDPQQHA